MEKLLTVSVAAYNVEKYLENALKSCICSNMIDYLEVIIVDDGSKDGTKDIAKKYEELYPDVFRYVGKENGGYGSTINSALSYATGRYFKLMDGDDWYNTDQLQLLLSSLKDCNSDMVVTDYTEVYEGTGKKNLKSYTDFSDKKEYVFSEICSNLTLCMHAVMFKTSILRNNGINISEKCFYTDAEFLMAPIPFVNTMKYFRLDIYQYRLALSGQSVSLEGMRKHYKDAGIVLEKLVPYVNSLPESDPRAGFMLKNLSVTADFQLRAYLCMKPNAQIKKELQSYDCNLKKIQPTIYKMIENKMTALLRKTGYRSYYLYSYYIILRMKLIQLIRNR